MGVWREVEASKGHATSLRGNMCCFGPWLMEGGVEISFGVLGSSLPDLEEEGLEGVVSSREAPSLGW